MIDMHCHLSFAADAQRFARRAASVHVGFFSNTVRPGEYTDALDKLGGLGNVRVGVGVHPWWVDAHEIDEEEMRAFERFAQGTRYIGEVGLDFSEKRSRDMRAQIDAFDRAMAACRTGGKLVSVHVVRAAGRALDIIAAHKVHESNHVVFHWFQGSQGELNRAMQMGCYFSAGPRMARTRQGRAYLRAVSAERLLVETDLPSARGDRIDYDVHIRKLGETVRALSKIRGCDVSETIEATSRALLCMQL